MADDAHFKTHRAMDCFTADSRSTIFAFSEGNTQELKELVLGWKSTNKHWSSWFADEPSYLTRTVLDYNVPIDHPSAFKQAKVEELIGAIDKREDPLAENKLQSYLKENLLSAKQTLETCREPPRFEEKQANLNQNSQPTIRRVILPRTLS